MYHARIARALQLGDVLGEISRRYDDSRRMQAFTSSTESIIRSALAEVASAGAESAHVPSEIDFVVGIRSIAVASLLAPLFALLAS